MTEFFDERGKSKSQRKRDHHALQELGRSLVELSPRQLKKIPLSETAREAIVASRLLQRGALQRQLRYLAGLLEHENSDAIRATLDAIYAPARANVKALHEVEQMRDDLLRSPESTIAQLVLRFPALDTAQLKQLASDALRTGALQVRSKRLIYQVLAQQMTNESLNRDPR